MWRVRAGHLRLVFDLNARGSARLGPGSIYYPDTDTDTDNVFRPSMAWVLWCLRHYNSQANTVLKMDKTQRETKIK